MLRLRNVSRLMMGMIVASIFIAVLIPITTEASVVYSSQFGTHGVFAKIQFTTPQGITTDSSGNIYVADTGNDRIQKFDSSGNFVMQFGSNGGGDGRFNSPSGLAIDSSGNIFVADRVNNRVQKFNSSGVYQSQFGSAGSGNGQFSQPTDVAVDSSGNIYVLDTLNNRIQKFNSSGVYQSQFGSAGSGNGQFNWGSQGGLHGIAFDSSGNIYVTDSGNNRVQKFNSSGVYQSQFGSAGSGNGQFNQPVSIIINSNGIYVADILNNRIEKFNSSGVYQSQFGSTGSSDGLFRNLSAIATDSSGNIYVADTSNNRVQKFNSSGVYQSQFGVQGTNTADPNQAAGQFNVPKGVAFDSSGNIYVVDTNNNRVEKFDSSGNFILQFGSTGSGDGQFVNPVAIAINATTSSVYVTDAHNNRVEKFDYSGVYQSKFGFSGSGNGDFNDPAGIAIDSSGNIYVMDPNLSRVQKFNSSGVYQSQFGSFGSGNGQFGKYGTDDNFRGMAIDSSGNIYVVDSANSRVQKFNSSGVYQSQFGTSGPGNGQFTWPSGITLDSAGNIYVSDSIPPYNNTLGNHRIQKFNPSGVYQSQFGSVGTNDGQFNNPQGIAFDASGAIYVIDSNNSRVEKFVNGNTAGTSPTFTMQFNPYSSTSTVQSAGTYLDNAKISSGIVYLVITSSKPLSSAPTISINAEGTVNDVTNAVTATTTGGGSYVYEYTYTINPDSSAVGSVPVDVSITATDSDGNTVTNVNPTNESTKVIYTDTVAPILSSATVNGKTVTLTFNEDITGGSTFDTQSLAYPFINPFTIKVDGATSV